tara:strand:+ start:1181 stop:1387 length:207 start_codon:yes stop_codon:yes gene_type:complete
MFKLEVIMAIKTYYLEIVVDTETDEVVLIDEEVVTERPAYVVGSYDMADYFDKESLDTMEENYTFGKS